MPIPIVCTTEELAGMFAEADREMELWFEQDVVLEYGAYAICVYPKLCWDTVSSLGMAA